jgi:hypothetical protein
MAITARALNRAMLGRQMLLGRESLDVVGAVRRVVAVQAQTPASPYVSNGAIVHSIGREEATGSR